MTAIRGRVRLFGDDIDTDMIIPAEHLVAGDLDHLGDFVFEKADPGFASSVMDGDIVVAGRNFGCGSSREHAPMALMQSGIRCVVAESFSRIFFRNAIDIGLTAITCKVDAAEGDTIEIYPDGGRVVSKGREYSFRALPPYVMSIIAAGGLVEKIRSEAKAYNK